MKRLFYPPPVNSILMVIMLLLTGNTFLFGEGSKDFRDYPGHRLFYNVEQNQQLKVYAAEGEFINLGSSHIGINGGFLELYRPDGSRAATYDGTGGTAIINNNVEEQEGPTGGGTTNGSGYNPGIFQVPTGQGGIWSIKLVYPIPFKKAFISNLLNSDPWTRDVDQPRGTISDQRVALAWDVTITQGGAGNANGTPIEGRLYSNEYISILDKNSDAADPRSTSPTFYILTESGYLYQVDFDRTDPWGFPINSNSLGIVNGNQTPTYSSYTATTDSGSSGNYTRSADPNSWANGEIYLFEPQAEDTGPLINNKIFFNLPDPNMPSTANVADVDPARNNPHVTWLYNQVPTLGNVGPFTFKGILPANSPCGEELVAAQGAGGYFVFDTELAGQATLSIDVNGNDSFSDDIDIVLTNNVSLGKDSILWNGTDGTGAVIPANSNFNFTYDLTIRGGEIHVLMLDVENNVGGVTFRRMNGADSPDDRFYYDHSGIGGGISGGGTAGNALPTTTAFVYSNGFGDKQLLDQWAFIETNNFGNGTLAINIEADCNGSDHDNDGIPDIVDIDDDNDGVPDLLEFCHPDEGWACLPGGLDPSGDEDGDEIQNYNDANDPAVNSGCSDTNADGICDQIIAAYDTDGDNVPDHYDLDSDNDGISDLVEAGHGQPDADRNGVIDGDNSVFGDNGLYNPLETNDSPTGIANYTPWDVDGDGIPDHDDLDSDNDGILDVVEAGYASSDSNQDGRVDDGNGNVPTVNSDGLVPLIDPTITGVGIPLPIDWDNDGIPDWHDLDSDNDGILDVIEGGYQGSDTNLDGRIDDGSGSIPTVNSDGLPPVMANSPINLPPDTDTDGVRDWHDLDSDNDGINGTVENLNPDGDANGIIGTGPITVDANGIAIADANGPLVPHTPLVNTDNTEAGDFRDLDADGDGINDVIEGDLNDPDGDGIIGTGIPTINVNGQSTSGTTSNPPDSDNNGTPDFQQVDQECDAPATPILAGTPTEICEGETVQLTATEVTGTDISYQWIQTISDGSSQVIQITTDPSLSFEPTAPGGTYTVFTIKDTCSSVVSNGVNIVVNAKPATPVLSANTTQLCEGESLTLTATGSDGADRYEWIRTDLDGSSLVVQVTTDPTVTINPTTSGDTGTYSVLASAGGGACPADTSIGIDITVTPKPAAPVLIVDNDVHCEGERLEFMATPIDGVTYEWTFTNPDGRVDPLATTNNPALVIENLVSTNTGFYQVRANLNGCLSDASNDVEVDVASGGIPNVTASSSASVDNPACEGDNVTLSVTPVDGATYEWSGPNGIVGTTAETVIEGATAAANGEYNVTVTINGCPKTLDPVTVQVDPKPATPSISVDNADVCPGEGFTLSTAAATGTAITYEWFLNGTSVATTNDPTLEIAAPTDADAGSYTVVVKDGGCPSDPSDPAVEVTVQPSVEGEITMEPTAGVCEGETVSLSAPVVDGATYLWTGPNDFTSTDATVTLENVTADANGDYSVTITVNDCPTDKGPVNLVINPKPATPSASSDKDTVCPGDAVTLTTAEATGNDITYDWLLDGTVVATTDSPSLEITDFQEANAGDYTVIVKDGSCPSEPSEAVSIALQAALEGASATSNSPVCIGDSIMLTATTIDNATYEWTGPNDFSSTEANPTIENATADNAGDYIVTITVDGCPATLPPTTVEVTPKPAAPTITLNETEVCEGTPATITITDPATIPDGITFTAMDADGNTVGSSSTATIEIATDGMAGTNTYTVISTMGNGCPSEPSNSVELVVTPKPDEEAMIIAPDGGDCGEIPSTIEAVAPTQGTGMWSSTSTTVVFDDPTNPITGISGLSDGDEITWTLTNEACGEYSSDMIIITIMSPEVTANDDSFTILNTETVTAGNIIGNDQINGEGAITIISGPSNGTATLSGNTINYTPNDNFVGTDQIEYELCNTICPTATCDRGIITFTVNQDPNSLICNVPDVITPNNDGLNDALVIPCSDFKNVGIKIFNRWGDKVFESDNYNNNWIGTHDGEPLPPGPYYYIFDEGGTEPITGCVAIAR